MMLVKWVRQEAWAEGSSGPELRAVRLVELSWWERKGSKLTLISAAAALVGIGLALADVISSTASTAIALAFLALSVFGAIDTRGRGKRRSWIVPKSYWVLPTPQMEELAPLGAIVDHLTAEKEFLNSDLAHHMEEEHGAKFDAIRVTVDDQLPRAEEDFVVAAEMMMLDNIIDHPDPPTNG